MMPAYILESHIRSVYIFQIETTVVGFILLHFVFPINYDLSLVSGCRVKPLDCICLFIRSSGCFS